MKTFPSFLTARIVAILFVFLAFSCGKDAEKFTESGMSVVEEITIDYLGRLDPIVIRFKDVIVLPDELNKAVSIAPAMKGAWSIIDDRTVQFSPASPYAAKTLSVAVDTGLLMGGAAKEKGITLPFTIHEADYDVAYAGLYTEESSGDVFSFSGSITTDIPVSPKQAAQLVKAELVEGLAETSLPIEWLTVEDSAVHSFLVKNIVRDKIDRTFRLSWQGKPIGAKKAGTETWTIPASAEFLVLEVTQAESASVLVRFSEPIDTKQDVRGFFRVGNNSNPRYSIDGNTLKLFNLEGLDKDTKVDILEGIRSTSGNTLKTQKVAWIRSSWDKPAVKFAKDGVILPTTNGVVVPIETMNLQGVIVEAFLISGNTIKQFLQVNDLDGSNELRRVGEPVWVSSFDFDWDDAMKNQFVARGLNLDALVKKYPAAMVQLRITFRQRHIKYQCTASHDDFSALPMPPDDIPLDKNDNDEYSYWSNWDGDWDTRNRFWTYRDDPCHPAFYLYDYNRAIVAKKNVLISDLGVMVKRDADGALYCTVTDMRTTEPVSGVDVAIYSYAQKELATGKTNAQGQILLNPSAQPMFASATKNGQTTWLKMQSGASLSVSHFEVDGTKAQKGVKGFIYGERGVWRPGDDIHLVFVMQDLKKQLPPNFPINFELQEPQGRIVKTGVFANAVDGFYRIDTGTSSDDPTGDWIARVKAGGQTWARTLKIETIVPNRLAITLATENPILKAKDNRITLSGAWLHGAKTPGFKADISTIFYQGDISFDGYSEYSFSNLERNVESYRKTVWAGKLGEDSSAKFSLDLHAGDSLPGKLKVQLLTRLFEPSGAFSTEQVLYDYSPYERYVGIKLPKGDAARGMLLTDTVHRMDIVLVNAEGKPVSDDTEITTTIYKLNWRWWWEKGALTDAAYVSSRSAEKISEGKVNVKNGKAAWDFEVKYPEWGRYLVTAVDKKGGHSASKIVYIDWPGWAGRSQDSGSGSAAMLTLTKDKTNYRSGENALVSFSSQAEGRALVTIEKNGSVVSQEWFQTQAGTTTYKLSLTPEMAPNVYVHVTMLQKHMQSANSLPIRLYGVVPVAVENPGTRLQPKVQTPAAYEPGKKASFTVSESSGQPMTYTVAVVDEGLLGLTRFSAPNPWNEFYKKEASLLTSWDIYRYVMSAYGGKLETLLSIGGGDDYMDQNGKKPERFKPVVQFFGPFELGARKSASHSFDMPQYVGAVRVMVVAGKNGAYGTVEEKVPVKSDLMVLPVLPRTLGANESIEVPVTLFNGKDSAQNVRVEFVATQALSFNETRTVTIPAQSNETIMFTLKTGKIGNAQITVRTGQNASSMTAESKTDIEVLSRGSETAVVEDITIPAGKTVVQKIASRGEQGSKMLSAEVSTLPVLDLENRLRYVISYPHGCIEQITSGGFPQLYVAKLINTSTDDTEKIKRNIRSVLDRYVRYQTPSGGFAYWPGDAEPNGWGSSYAGHFMLEARNAGYELPSDVYQAWLSYQQTASRNWGSSRSSYDSEIQAYRLFTLALSGNPEIAAMNRLNTDSNATPIGKMLLAAAYSLAGHRDSAERIVRAADVKAPKEYHDTGNNWGSSLRDSALMLNTLNIMDEQRISPQLAASVAKEFGGRRWLSTQETAWAVLALSPHYSMRERQPQTYTLETAGNTVKGSLLFNSAIHQLIAAEADEQSVTMTNNGNRTLYARITARGMLPPGEEKALASSIRLSAYYTDEAGKRIEASKLKVGDSFTIRVGISNLKNERINNIALSVPIPTCWEFGNERLAASDTSSSAVFDFQDIRDTAVHSYFSLASRESKDFRFYATVAFDGSYYIPAIRAEAMYDAEIQAVLQGQKIDR